jgi:polyferredoxin
MTEATKKPFNYRAFWSLLAAITVVGLPWTGIENHDHQFEGLTAARHGWMAAHNILATLFVVAVVAHVVLNWRTLLKHARGLMGRVVPLSREALVALAVTAGLLLVFVGHTRLAGDRPVGAAHARPPR